MAGVVASGRFIGLLSLRGDSGGSGTSGGRVDLIVILIVFVKKGCYLRLQQFGGRGGGGGLLASSCGRSQLEHTAVPTTNDCN